MIKQSLTTRQKEILKMYLNKVSGSKMSRDLKMSRSLVYKEIRFLIDNGFTGKEPIIKPLPEPTFMIEVPDTLVETMITFKLTDEQRNEILNNTTLSRTELAKKLGIKKPHLLYVLQKMNINMETKMSWKV